MLVDRTLQSCDNQISLPCVFNTFKCHYHETMTSLIYSKTHCPDLPISYLVCDQNCPKCFEMLQ